MEPLAANDPQTLGEGRYTLLGILGEGSMGRTYLAEGESGRVAVKALYPSRLATVKDLELFVREAEVLRKLDHPRIPSYIDAFDEGEGEGVRYHLVQEWVDGETLRSKMSAGTRFAEAEVISTMRSLLKTLLYMHGCDPTVVHRDIKPDNIILRAADGEPALVDFGAVREVVRLTMGGGSTIIGTYGYMPPEQLMGRSLPASDIYSVGVTALEMLTRQTPQDLHGEDVKRLIKECNVTDAFRRVLTGMCAPELSARYASADAVIKDLDAVEGGGALVHARSIEHEIQKREDDRQRALRKASTPGILHLGYMTLIGFIGLGAIAGIYTLATMLATGFEGTFLAAGVVSAAGMFITLLLLGLRYTHDAWAPPTSKWLRTRGKITGYTQAWYDELGNALPESQRRYRVHYGFQSRRGGFEAEFLVEEAALPRYPEGMEFDVYYQSGKPEWHEIQDFLHDPDDAMSRLFDSAVTHTPE